MKHCFFCQATYSEVEVAGLPRIKCANCSQYDIQLVYTYFLEKQPIYADILINSRSKEFVFTLYLKEDYTNLWCTSEDYSKSVRIPGFPVNPDNARQKLKIYLLFS